MYLKDVVRYPVQIVKNNKIIFDDSADNIPSELKNYEINNVDFINNKLVLGI